MLSKFSSIKVKVDIRYINWMDEEGDELDSNLANRLCLPRTTQLTLELEIGGFDEADLYRRCTDRLNEKYWDTGMSVQDISIINIEELKKQVEI